MSEDPHHQVNEPADGTDKAWEDWGRLEPYYSVLTNPKFKMAEMDTDSKNLFFDSGRIHVDTVMHDIRQHVVSGFNPNTVLDFGCGVGRLVIPFSRLVREVVGLDVSQTMLQLAQENCSAQGVNNVRLHLSDDSLTVVASQKFDLVHSAIVFQHIPKDRGKLIFQRLLDCVAPGGVAAIQLLYSKSIYASTYGIAPAPEPAPKRWYKRGRRVKETTPSEHPTPEMQMNPYNVNELLYFMQIRGVKQFFSRFTDHGGELGLWMFFQVF
jgi:SAM-dependent methyltransferase